jgi:hypothetical protein
MSMYAARHIHHRPRPGTAEGAPGELVMARLPGTGTWGRVILIARTPQGWLALRCTTRRETDTGWKRAAVPNPSAVGLHQPGWLCALPIAISDRDLGSHIGWADHALVDTITANCRITRDHATGLRRAVAHHTVRTHLAAIGHEGRA